MNKSFIKEHRIELMLAAVVVLEIMVLFFYNIFHLRDALDHDFAMVLRHVIEMGDNHTLFLKHWSYMSQGEMDEASLIALPIYMLTKRIYTGYAVAGIINILLWAYTVWRLLKLADMRPAYRLVALALIFTAYDFGMLEYTNMLFFAGGYYVYKVLLPLMMLVLLLTSFKGKDRAADICLSALYCILLFFVSVASGTYSLLLGIFPILICLIFCVILGLGKEKYPQWGAVTALTLIITAIGLFISHRENISTYTYGVKSLESVFEELPLTIRHVFELLRALTPYEERVSSLHGIIGLIHLLAAAFIIVFGLLSCINIFGLGIYRSVRDKKDISEISPKELSRRLIHDSLISIALWNFAALALTYSTPRYHIMGVIPLMLCAAFNLEELLSKDNSTKAPAFFLTLIAAVLTYVCLYTGVWAETTYFHYEDETQRTIKEIIALMDEEDINTAFTINLTDLTANLRLEDTSRVFETYMPEDGFVDNHIFYLSERDRSAFSDKNILLCLEGEFEQCPGYIRESYEKAGEAGPYDIMLSESCPIDGVAGIPLSDRDSSVDLASACGMFFKGELDGRGYLHTDRKGVVLQSPEFYSDGARAYRLSCELEGEKDGLSLELYKNGELMGTYEAGGADPEIEALLPGEEGTYSYIIRKEGKDPAVIGRILFTAEP